MHDTLEHVLESPVTTGEKRFLATGHIDMGDTQIIPDNGIHLCCMELFIGKTRCVPGEEITCLVCGKTWGLDGFKWRVKG